MGSTAERREEEEQRSCRRKRRRPLRLHMPELSVFAMPFLEGDPGGAEGGGSTKGEPLCHSASPTRSFFHRAPFSRPSSPRSAPARTSSSRMSPSSPKTLFPYHTGPPQQDSPPKSPRRLITETLLKCVQERHYLVMVRFSVQGSVQTGPDWSRLVQTGGGASEHALVASEDIYTTLSSSSSSPVELQSTTATLSQCGRMYPHLQDR
ncbi:uncharacterized protein LOC111647311 [Seriola lalandi dorsalis]|uniref:uncharacterized protein LOC111647311 n=1 Tax=Seriola lalandi dorsalis TaxID=1841481 RepID=UPI000C6F7A6A|nr:uncharacterized protein LOC111647311 [Seriola lalandi dorsalis]